MGILKLNKHKGIALILAYSVITAMLILSMAVIQRSISEMNQARIKRLYTEAFYLAEAGLEQVTYNLVNQIANHQTPDFSGTIGSISAFHTISYAVEEVETSDTKATSPKGIVTFKRLYKITATATHNQFSGIAVTVNHIISRNKTYTFQHAVFYADDLEVLPGQNMTISGRVHSNYDIYAASTATLRIDSDYVHSAGRIYNMRKDDGSELSGDVEIKSHGLVFPKMQEASEFDPLDCRRSDWASESQVRWEGNVKSSVHGVTALAIPAVGSIQPNGYYADNAGLKIIRDTAGNYQYYSNCASGSCSSVTIPGGIVTETTIYNKRENKTINITDINVGALNSSGYFPANGLLYVSRGDSTAAAPSSVRLKNGSTLSNKITVVTNNPLYIQGDYNSSAKKAAAVICDSVNILSNNWLDANGNQSSDPFSGKVAVNTTINVAFIAGIKTTAGSTYSGGLENYLRLHENWSGKTLIVRGSFVELWNSSIATGNWVYGDPYYTAPTRNWDYDSDFNNESDLPPFTPFAIEAERIAWWQS